MNASIASAGYAALRHGGAPPARARSELQLSKRTGWELEQLFQRRKWGHSRAQRPAFARHDAHVKAVLAAGGFPVLPGNRR